MLGKLGARAVQQGGTAARGVGDLACGVCSSSAGAAAAAQLELTAVDAAIAAAQFSPRRVADGGDDMTVGSDELLSSDENGEADNGRFSPSHQDDRRSAEEQSPLLTPDKAATKDVARSPSTASSVSSSPFSTGDDATGHPARARLRARLAAVRAAKMAKQQS